MKCLVIFMFVAAVSAAPGAEVLVLSYVNNPFDNEQGKYDFKYHLDDGSRHEQKGELRNPGLENEYLSVFGEYSWVAPNGVRYTVKYNADENGFNSHLEKGQGLQPPLPPTTRKPIGFRGGVEAFPSPFEIVNALLSR